MILNEKVSVKSMILNWKKYYVSEFELKKIQRVGFWIEIFLMCQIFYQFVRHVSGL